MVTPTVTRTIRIESSLDRAIQKYAQDEKVSSNFVASKALRAFLEWQVVSSKIGLASIQKSQLVRLLTPFEDIECEEMGAWAARETFKPLAERRFHKLDFQGSIEIFRMFSEYGHRYDFDYVSDGDARILFLKHSSGRKWSLYYRGLFNAVYGRMLGGKVEIEFTDELCVAKIELSS